jgi:malonyl-CoA/methylmalonyl-CoA synthetase
MTTSSDPGRSWPDALEDDAGGLPLFARAAGHRGRTALVADRAYTYGELLDASAAAASRLLGGEADLDGQRVAFLVAPGFAHVAVQWGIWRAGGIAVPLAMSHPTPELEYTIRDADASIVVAEPALAERVRPIVERLGLHFLGTEDLTADAAAPRRLPRLGGDRAAMILYTSGTTSHPKGVVTTHDNLQAQVETLVEAWAWSADDHILLVLPLHHVHGIVNVLTCALWSGAKCTVQPGFEVGAVWKQLEAGGLTLFMAVPTIYGRLIAAWDAAGPADRERLSAGARRLRLMVSGSAALPVNVLERWREITGHTLLERYGMTEIGMALANPLEGERRPGFVGIPLPGVEVRAVNEDGHPVPDGTPGELAVRGGSVFREYWRRPDATRDAFRNGWFLTGDVATVEGGYYRILGRSSVDILKTGGYKVSALEIEEALRGHPSIVECAVVGVEDPDWGDRVCAAAVLFPGHSLSLDELRSWAAQRLAPYKIPRELRTVAALPRNAMGKVTKPEVKKLFERLR